MLSAVVGALLVRTLMSRRPRKYNLSCSTSPGSRTRCTGRYRETHCILGFDVSEVASEQKAGCILWPVEGRGSRVVGAVIGIVLVAVAVYSVLVTDWSGEVATGQR
jgi:hypothetical protein